MKTRLLIYTFLLSIIGVSCSNEETKEVSNENTTVLSSFLKDTGSLWKYKGNDAIKELKELSEAKADKIIRLNKNSIESILEESKNYSSCIIIVEDHTIIKITDLEDCELSGSWDTCMPRGEGYIIKGGLKYIKGYINYIIGKEDNSKRIAYLFDKKAYIEDPKAIVKQTKESDLLNFIYFKLNEFNPGMIGGEDFNKLGLYLSSGDYTSSMYHKDEFEIYNYVSKIYNKPIFTSNENFKHYDFTFVRWLNSLLDFYIDNDIYKDKIQKFYDNTSIKYSIRTLYLALLELNSNGNIESLTNKYIDVMYYRDNYDYDKNWDWDTFTGTLHEERDIAIAFWIRRNIDGSMYEFDRLLSKVVKNFDAGYYDGLKVYKEKMIEIDKDQMTEISPSLTMETSKFLIIVEESKDDSYTYSSWSKPKTINDKPDVTIKNGKYISQGSAGNHSYEFTYDIYKYECYIEVAGPDDRAPGYLVVYKNNKEILIEPAMSVKEN